MKKRFGIVISAMREVFHKPVNVVIAVLIIALVLFAAIWLSNGSLLKTVFFTDTFSLRSKLAILGTSLGGLKTNFSATSRSVTIAVAVLFGINVTMMVHYLRRRAVLERSMGAGIVGAVVGMFGVGCAACGSALLSVFFGTAFTAGVVGVLPMRGLEFGLLGILTLIVSIYLASKKVVQPAVCRIETTHNEELT